MCSPPEEGEQPDPVRRDVHPPKGLSDRLRRSQRAGPRRSWIADPEWDGWDSRSAGRNPNAMMLRSAEADPHVTEHVARAPAETRKRVARNRGPHAATPKRHRGTRNRTDRRRRLPPCGHPVSARYEARRRPYVVAATEVTTHSGICASAAEAMLETGLVRTSRCSQLQGVAPLTSPWCHTAVASAATLDPSMGFVPLQGPLNSALSQRCQTGEDARPSRNPSARPRPFPRRSKLRQRPGDRIPLEVHSPPPEPKPGQRERYGEPKPSMEPRLFSVASTPPSRVATVSSRSSKQKPSRAEARSGWFQAEAWSRRQRLRSLSGEPCREPQSP